MYESLTALIPAIEKGEFGEWSKQTGDGSEENPLVFCHIEYSEPVNKLLDELRVFSHTHAEEMNLRYYPGIEADIQARWQGKNLFDIDVSLLDGRLTIGLLLIVISMCRFNDEYFLECCESGCTLRCLKRLKEIDEIGEEKKSMRDIDRFRGCLIGGWR